MTDGSTVDAPRPSDGAAGLRLAILVLALVAMGAIATGYGPELGTIDGWIEGLGWVAPVVFAVVGSLLLRRWGRDEPSGRTDAAQDDSPRPRASSPP